MSAADIRARKLADADIAAMRRTGLRPPHIRPWGIAAGAQPYRRDTSTSAVGWWVFVAAVAVCAAVIGAALGITPTFF